MTKLIRSLFCLLLISSYFACQKPEVISMEQSAPKTAFSARYENDDALIDYLIDRIRTSNDKGNTCIFMDQQGNQMTNPDRKWLESYFADSKVADRASSAQTFAYVEAVGTSGQIQNNLIRVYRSGSTFLRGTLNGTSSPAGQGANTNLLKYVEDTYCNDYWGSFSHNGLSSIEIDVFLRNSTTPWVQRHATVTAPVFSGYIITDFCPENGG